MMRNDLIHELLQRLSRMPVPFVLGYRFDERNRALLVCLAGPHVEDGDVADFIVERVYTGIEPLLEEFFPEDFYPFHYTADDRGYFGASGPCSSSGSYRDRALVRLRRNDDRLAGFGRPDAIVTRVHAVSWDSPSAARCWWRAFPQFTGMEFSQWHARYDDQRSSDARY